MCLVFHPTHLTQTVPHVPHRNQHFIHSLVNLLSPQLGEIFCLHLGFVISGLISNPEMSEHILTFLVSHTCSPDQVRGLYPAF